ncbi:MAG: hypothetical protein ABIP75_01885 [Pyrinomonadaceae bacterium]
MNHKNLGQRSFPILLLMLLCATSIMAQTTAFNYQGKLTDGGSPATGAYLLQFSLFDAPVGGNKSGITLSDVAVTATQGVFSTQLDFGASVYTGEDRFLEIAVRRNVGETYVTLSPREKIASSPYSVRTLSAAQADVALDANKLGGVDASEYVTTTSVGSSFIRNGLTQQTGNFNITGLGVLGGNLGIGTIPQLDLRLDVNGNATFRTANGNVNFGTPSGETGLTITGTNRADIRFDGTTLKLLAGTGTGAMASTNGINVNRFGNVGIGTVTPNTRLTLNGGTPWTANGWTASMNLQNASALGWEANASGQQFGIGQTGGGLFFFRTNSVFGNTAGPANYDLQISDTGNLLQPLNRNGVVKAIAFVRVVRDCFGGSCSTLTPSIVNCFNSLTNSTTGNCGFSLPAVFSTGVDIDFGFQVNNRFISLTPGVGGGSASIATFVGTNRVSVANGSFATSEFYVFVY